jgi:DNA-binding transcriptional LysR family regulator
MQIDQIRTFLAVAAAGGFHRAARALHISQPAVSARIRGLEESLGVELFVRKRRVFELSVAGRVLKPHAERVMCTLTVATEALRDHLPSPSQPSLKIAAPPSICAYILPQILSRFRKEQRHATVTVHSGCSKDVLWMVLNGEADLGFTESVVHSEIQTISFGQDALVLTSPSKLKKKGIASLEEVAKWALILFDKGSDHWTATQKLFHDGGFVPNVVYEVQGVETAKRLVRQGLGHAFLPQLVIKQEIRDRTLFPIDISDAEPLYRRLDVIHPRHRCLSRQTLALLRIVQNQQSNAELTRRSIRGHPECLRRHAMVVRSEEM